MDFKLTRSEAALGAVDASFGVTLAVVVNTPEALVFVATIRRNPTRFRSQAIDSRVAKPAFSTNSDLKVSVEHIVPSPSPSSQHAHGKQT